MTGPKAAADTLLLLRRSAREGVRNPVVAFVLPTVFPLSMIALTSQAYGMIVMLPGFPIRPYAAYLAPGILVLSAMMAAGYSAGAIVIDCQSGFLDRLRLLPVGRTSLLLGRMLFEVVRVLPAAVVVLAVSVALGTHLAYGIAGASAAMAIVVLWSLAYNGIFFAVALRTRNAAAPIALMPMVMPLMFLSPAFMPKALQPHWIQVAGALNPFTYLIEGVRPLLTGGFSWTPVGEALAAAAFILVVSGAFTARSFATLMRGD